MFGPAGAGNEWVNGHHIGGAMYIDTVLTVVRLRRTASAPKFVGNADEGMLLHCEELNDLVKKETEVCDPLQGLHESVVGC